MALTEDKLLQFHVAHFANQTLPALSHPALGFGATDATYHLENSEPDDHMLGHYADGVKRILTDEQVAIFRHTEIQELLRERRARSAGFVGQATQWTSADADDTCDVASLGGRHQQLRPSEMDKEEKNEEREGRQGGGDTMAESDYPNTTWRQHNTSLRSDGQDRGLLLPSKSSLLCGRKVVKYHEGVALTVDPIRASFSTEGLVESEFKWPELRQVP